MTGSPVRFRSPAPDKSKPRAYLARGFWHKMADQMSTVPQNCAQTVPATNGGAISEWRRQSAQTVPARMAGPSALRAILIFHECGHRAGGLRGQLFVHDQVPAEDRIGLVPRDLHPNRLLNAGADQVAHRRAAEVVKQPSRQARLRAGVLPRAAKFLEGAAPPVKDGRAQTTRLCLPMVDRFPLPAQDQFEPRVILEG